MKLISPKLKSEFKPLSKRYAFVLPRFGESIAGGAETLVGSLASKLSERGNDVVILTTCAKDNRTWNNELPRGESIECGVKVHRFPVDERNLDVWIPRQIEMSKGKKLSLDDELLWMKESVNSEELYAHIAAHSKDYDAIFFAPYLFGTTFWGSLIAPERSFLIPCLHDESYAYTKVMGSVFRQVRGALFNSEPERDLASRIFGGVRGGEVGMGFEAIESREQESYGPYFKDAFPYILYLGRKETGKNAQLLIDYFIDFKDKYLTREGADPLLSEVKLVIAGGGSFSDLERPEALLRSDILDLDHLSETDKRRLIRHADFLCQPSTNESFSIVLMEAWRLHTPVLVHAGCPVTKKHVIDSGGGLYFGSSIDFALTAQELCSNKELSSALAAQGDAYVKSYYSWDAVISRFDKVMEQSLNDD